MYYISCMYDTHAHTIRYAEPSCVCGEFVMVVVMVVM